MSPFRFKGSVQIEHLNARKVGPKDSKTLAVDLKLSARVTDAVFHFFDDQLLHAVWLPGGAVRNIQLGPLCFGHELEDYRADLLGNTHFGVKVKAFSLAVKDGREVDLVFSISLGPQGTDMAVLAEHLQESLDITLQPANQDLLIEDDGIWCINPLVQMVRVDGGGHGDDLSDSDLFSSTSSASDDDLIEQARQLVITHRKASISFIQRHLQIGYNRAARLMEALQAEGLVSAMNVDGNRVVLADAEVDA
jgi:Ftsk gamma domain